MLPCLLLSVVAVAILAHGQRNLNTAPKAWRTVGEGSKPKNWCGRRSAFCGQERLACRVHARPGRHSARRRPDCQMGTVDADLAYLKKEALNQHLQQSPCHSCPCPLQDVYAHLGKVIDRVVAGALNVLPEAFLRISTPGREAEGCLQPGGGRG